MHKLFHLHSSEGHICFFHFRSVIDIDYYHCYCYYCYTAIAIIATMHQESI